MSPLQFCAEVLTQLSFLYMLLPSRSSYLESLKEVQVNNLYVFLWTLVAFSLLGEQKSINMFSGLEPP